MNITDPIRHHARVQPQSTAVILMDGHAISYQALDWAIDVIGRRLLEMGVGPGNTVALRLRDGFQYFVLSLACARFGAAGAPSHLPAQYVDLCIADAGTPLIGEVRTQFVDALWWQLPPVDPAVPPLEIHRDSAATFHIFSSSGTTGVPKFIALSHDAIAERIFRKWLAYRLPDGAATLCFVGAGMYYGYNSSLRVLWTGGQLVLTTRIDTIVPLIEKHRVRALVLAPNSLESIVAPRPAHATPLPSLQVVEVGGSMLPMRLYQAARQKLCKNIISSYGAMEVGAIASAPMERLAGIPGALGFLHPGIEVEAVDANDVPVPPGTDGILRVRTRTSAGAYLGDPALSDRVFRNGWTYLGDTGAVSREGLVTLAGRVGEIINSGGNKVSPQAIEDVLLALPWVREAAAFGMPDGLGVTRVWAAIVPNGDVDSEMTHAHCRQQLQDRAPAWIMQIAALPRNANGKVVREELKRIAILAQQKQATTTVLQ
jgi:long-chain acyl-CoA synthetase